MKKTEEINITEVLQNQKSTNQKNFEKTSLGHFWEFSRIFCFLHF